MDITIQNKKQEALFKNGKYYYTFTPKQANEVIKIHHEGCIGDTRLTHIQLEQNNDFTYFVEPTHKVNSLSGIFKNLRDLDVQLRDQNSEFWGKLKLNNKGMLTEFYNKNIETKFTAMAGTINQSVKALENNVVKKSDITIKPDSISFGTGTKIDGNTVASLMKLQPNSIKLISPLISVTGDMIVDGTLTSNKFASKSIKTGHLAAGSVITDILATNAVTANNVLIDTAMINKFATNKAFITRLWAEQAFINELKAVSINASQITGGLIKGELLKGVNIEGATLKGDTTIKIGEYGFLSPISNGLQINAPDGLNSKKGVSLQLHGNLENRGNNRVVPKGLFIYSTPDFTQGQTIYPNVDDYLLTIGGLIKGAFKYNGSVTSGTPVMTNLWMNNPVSYTGNSKGGMYAIRFIGYVDGAGSRKSGVVFDDGTGTNGQWVIYPDEYNSDIRLKKNIVNSKHSALSLIDKFNFYSFDWKPDKFGVRKQHTKIGLLADEVQELDNSLVFESGENNIKNIEAFRLLNINLKATQELYHNQLLQDEKILQLENKIKQLEVLLNG